MTAVERTAYPEFRAAVLTDAELTRLYEPTAGDLAFVRSRTRVPHTGLTLLVLLKCQQRLGYPPHLDDVPDRIVAYMADALALDPQPHVASDHRQTVNRFQQTVREYLDARGYSEGGEALASRTMYEAAFTRSDPADLINVAIEALLANRIELPAYSTLYRLSGRARMRAHDVLYDRVT